MLKLHNSQNCVFKDWQFLWVSNPINTVKCVCMDTSVLLRYGMVVWPIFADAGGVHVHVTRLHCFWGNLPSGEVGCVFCWSFLSVIHPHTVWTQLSESLFAVIMILKETELLRNFDVSDSAHLTLAPFGRFASSFFFFPPFLIRAGDFNPSKNSQTLPNSCSCLKLVGRRVSL